MTTHNQQLYRPESSINLLRIPLLGRILQWRYGRLVLQLPFFILAALIVIDGFTGPDLASRNLATVAPWVHYRGLVVIALLLVGNLFCMGCPFTIPRTLAKRLSIRGYRFPRVLRNKWLAIASLFVLFFLYEWLDLWSSPTLTAWVVVFYFVASFVLEAVFTESAFCKYVCPLGTFNFVYSTASPTQISVKDATICSTCVGKECVNGSYSPQPIIRIDEISGGQQVEVRHDAKGTLGCGTLLFAPQIKSNLDCTLCLDCVRACPHENIGWMVRKPGRELGIKGAWLKRWDISLLVVFLTFLGLVNAFAMVPPVYELQLALARLLQTDSEFIVFGIVFVIGTLLLPLLMVVLVANVGRWLTRTSKRYNLRETIGEFAPAFVPVGFAIWIAHYGFHFLIGPLTMIPVLQELFGMTGNWEQFGLSLDVNIISFLQFLVMVGGFLWTMLIAQRISLRLYRNNAALGLLPWAIMFLLIMFAAIYVFGLPMEMRGIELVTG